MNLSPAPDRTTQTNTTWNQYAATWKRWEAWTRLMTQPIGNAIIEALQLKRSDVVLDVATGSGEPGLSIAALLDSGKVTGVDLSENMLEAAESNALAQGLLNFETLKADACVLPFEAQRFDKISCRQGFMFFSEMALAAAEMHRVLVRGGRLAASVWADRSRNLWATVVVEALANHGCSMNSRDDIFRCSAPGQLACLLQDAGFNTVEEKLVAGYISFQSEGAYWRHFTSVVAPVAKAIAECSAEVQRSIRQEVYAALQIFKTADGFFDLPFAARVVSGCK